MAACYCQRCGDRLTDPPAQVKGGVLCQRCDDHVRPGMAALGASDGWA